MPRHDRRWLSRPVTSAILLVSLLLTTTAPVLAQSSPPAVLILPMDGAQFLPGARFDLRVEVHAAELPSDLAVTINGEDASTFFRKQPRQMSWTFGPEEEPITSQSFLWTRLSLDTPGEYTVDVTAGGETHTAAWTVREPQAGTAKNIILFIADGGTVASYTAARLISRGQTQGTYNDQLVFETFEELGLLHTSGIDSIITDSANSASAYNTGHKTAVNATGSYPDTSPSRLDDPRVETFAEMAARTRGMAIGVVTTSDFTDATPAAVWAHGRDRSSANRATYALQALVGLRPQVIMGGGGRFLLPNTVEGSARRDAFDMFARYEDAGYTVVTSASELETAMGTPPERLMGIFHPADMNVWLDRNVYTDNLGAFPDQPGLVDMTLAALGVLNQDPDGFFLEVEGASVDKQLHPMDFDRAHADTIEFERAIAAAYEWVQQNAPDTLLVVTSDHGHSFDVYGTVDKAAFNAATSDDERRAAIGIYAQAGFPDYVDADGNYFPDSWDINFPLAQGKVDNPLYTEDFQVSTTPRVPALLENGMAIDNPDDDPNGLALGGNLPGDSNSSVHTLQDVPVYAQGPGSSCLGRVMENIEVFFCLAAAIGLDPSAPTGLAAR